MKWTTHVKFVDLETGEELTPQHLTKGLYVKVKQIKHTIIDTHYGHKHITWECRRNPQQHFEF